MNCGDPYRQKPEMQWKLTPEIHELWALDGFKDFHGACARQQLLFDHVERVPGKRVEWECIAYRCKREERSWEFSYLAEGKGSTPLAAMTDAYEKSGVVVPDAAALISRMRGSPPVIVQVAPADIDLEDLLG